MNEEGNSGGSARELLCKERDKWEVFRYFLFNEFLVVVFFLIFIWVELIYKVALASGIYESDSDIHISILFQILFPYRLLQNIEYSSLCYTVGLCVCVSSVTQSCLTLCDPTDCSPPGSSVHGIFQARILEWVAISYSKVLVRYLFYM